MARKLQYKYRFRIDVGIVQYRYVVVLAESPDDARHDAYAVIQDKFGQGARVLTHVENATMVKRANRHMEPVVGCYKVRGRNNERQYWAWWWVEDAV